MDKSIEKAVTVLNQGGIIIFPTDTAFGIGCRIDRPTSVEKLFAIRKRPLTQATPVLVSSMEMAEAYVAPLPSEVKSLIQTHWPGGLTIVYHAANPQSLPSLILGNGSTLGVRMPNHAVILEIIKNVGVPILGPSANFSGQPTPYTLADLDPELVTSVDYVVPGECLLKQPSTVIDCTQTPFKIIRQGAVRI